jgi:hypothetical protein
MTIFTIHLPASGQRRATGDDVALAAERFSWGAFLFGPLWLLVHRLWLWTLVWAAAALIYGALATTLRGAAAGWALFLGAVLLEMLLGFEANELYRRSLERSGRPAVAVVSARNSNAAAARFFRRQAQAASAASPDGKSGAERPSPPSSPPGTGFLSLFPGERAP